MLRALTALSLLIVAMFVFGPQETLDPAADRAQARKIPVDPSKLEDFIRQSERAATGEITRDCEARIVWAPDAPPATTTPWAVVHLHGFSATRQETAPLMENLARQLGANLFEARLSGHGQSGDALAAATAEDWLRDSREAVLIGRRLGQRLLLIGNSTGGTLATLVAQDLLRPEDALVLMSPNFGTRVSSSELLLWPWARYWAPLIAGKTRTWTPKNDMHGKYWTHSYPISALFPMMATVDAGRRAKVEAIKSPVLVVVSDKDPTVDPGRTRKLFAPLRDKNYTLTEITSGGGDHHVLAGEILSSERTEEIENTIMNWVQKLSR